MVSFGVLGGGVAGSGSMRVASNFQLVARNDGDTDDIGLVEQLGDSVVIGRFGTVQVNILNGILLLEPTLVSVSAALNTDAAYQVDGTQVVSNQGAAVADASGGAVIDTEARAALNALLARTRTHGLIAT